MPSYIYQEALRLARRLAKEALRAQGIPLSSVSSRDITIAAKALLEKKEEIWLEAKRAIARELVNFKEPK